MKAMVFPRGMDPTYYTFTGITVEANGMKLIVDRRRRDRRREESSADVERRIRDRRQQPAVTWTRDGFLVTEGELDERSPH